MVPVYTIAGGTERRGRFPGGFPVKFGSSAPARTPTKAKLARIAPRIYRERRKSIREISHDLVTPGNQRLTFLLCQIRFRRVKHLVVTELSRSEHLAVALDEIVGVLQVVLKAEGPAKIDSPNLPILGYEHIGQIRVHVGEDADLIHLLGAGVQIRRLDLPFVPVGLIKLDIVSPFSATGPLFRKAENACQNWDRQVGTKTPDLYRVDGN
jgi:hypothetical protein